MQSLGVATIFFLALGAFDGTVCAETVSTHQLAGRDYVREWILLGPFPNHPVEQPMPDGSSHFGYSTDYLSKLGGEAGARFALGQTLSYADQEGEQRTVTARRISADRRGVVDLNEAFGGVDYKVAYAYSTIFSEESQTAGFLFGSDDSAKVWINGKLVHSIYVGRGLTLGQDQFIADLEEGENTILVKVTDWVRDWGFAVEAMDAEAYGRHQAEAKEWADFRAFLDTRVRPVVGNEWDYLFGPGEFPKLEWERPYLVEKVMGEFPLTVRWFDGDLNEVSTAATPGRYGWVADGTTPEGVHIRRAGTLYCPSWDWYAWAERPQAHLEFLASPTVDQEAWQEREAAISDFAGRQVLLSILRQEEGAVLMSYLDEMEATGEEASPVDTPSIRDLEYHLALKRKLMGVEDAYPELAMPRAVKGEDAPVLQQGSHVDAGMRSGTAERLREVADAWFADSREPFDLLIARRGVIVLHETFGDWPWGELTLDTPKPIASTTKLITGTLFAQFVDQGLIGIDDPVGKFLPDFTVEGERAATFRHLFTHTTGLWGHQEWGGVHNPYLENVAAIAMSRLPVGKTHEYNGMGYDLAGKVMEVVSGKSIFRLMRENFFDPLGLENTTLEEDLGFSCNTTAGDLAVIGQLLLNRGSYGDLEFFSPDTFEQLMPKPLQQFYPEIEEDWGIGLTWMHQPHPDAGTDGVPVDKTILSRNVIGHGAATSAILRVDLDNDLVITQTRRIGGRNYEEHLTKLLLAIEAGLEDGSLKP